MKRFTLLLSLLLWMFLVKSQDLVQIFPDAPGMTMGSTTWFDYDGDGDMDLLLTGFDPSETNNTFLYANDGEGNFTLVNNSGLPLLALSSVDTADWDGDGDVDLLIMGIEFSGDLVTDIYINNGDGTFSAGNIGLSPSDMGSCKFVDYNNDGFLDVFLSGFDNATYISNLYKNDQNGGLTLVPNTGLQGVAYSAAVWADFDDDGYEDLFLCGMGFYPDPNISIVYKNNGDDTFSEIQSFTGLWCVDVAIADYDSDGDVDILFSGYDEGSMARLTFLMRNDGGVFNQVADNIVDVSHPGLAWADYDNDGKPDIFITGAHEIAAGQIVAKLYHNEGEDVFEDSNFFFTGLWWADAAWADIDGDTDMDLVYSGQDDQGVSHTFVYRNDVINNVKENTCENTVSVYPNPAKSEIFLSVFNATFDKISIVNSLGERLWNATDYHSNKIDISGLKAGVYLLLMEKSGTQIRTKFVKE